MPTFDKDAPAYARAAAHMSWALTADPSARTAPARSAFLNRFEALVDPDELLRPDVRRQRAEAAKKAYFLTLAAKSAAVRRQRSGTP